MTNTNYHIPALETMVGEGFSNIQTQESPPKYYDFAMVNDPSSPDILTFNTSETHKFLTLIESLISSGQLDSSWDTRSLRDEPKKGKILTRLTLY